MNAIDPCPAFVALPPERGRNRNCLRVEEFGRPAIGYCMDKHKHKSGPLADAGRWLASGGPPSAVLGHCDADCPRRKKGGQE
jgi:hypothetical protein